MTLPASHSQPADAPVPEPRIVHNEEVVLSHMLRTGVILSIALVILGTYLIFRHHPEFLTTAYPLVDGNHPDARLASRPFGSETSPRSVPSIIDSVSRGQGRGFVLLGLMVLLSTPVISVGSAIIAFGMQKDRPMALLAASVFLILSVSFFLGQSLPKTPPSSTAPATRAAQ